MPADYVVARAMLRTRRTADCLRSGPVRRRAEGLFAAASEFDLRLPDLDKVPRGEVGARLAHHFLDRWEEDDSLNALLRVGVTNSAGAERMQAVFREQVRPVVESVCPDPARAGERAALAASQILGMALSRYVLKMSPAVELTRLELVAWLGPTLQRYPTAEEAEFAAD